MNTKIDKRHLPSLLFIICSLFFSVALTACTGDDISNPTASVVIPINTGDVSQAVAE